MLGIIGIEKLRVMTLIGVYPHERHKKQELLIDLRAECEMSICSKSDAVEDALNYHALAERCQEIAKNSSFYLIESFAVMVLDILCAEFPISWIWVKVSKPNALDHADLAYVEMKKFIERP